MGEVQAKSGTVLLVCNKIITAGGWVSINPTWPNLGVTAKMKFSSQLPQSWVFCGLVVDFLQQTGSCVVWISLLCMPQSENKYTPLLGQI